MPPVFITKTLPPPKTFCPVLFVNASAFAAPAHVHEMRFQFVADPIQSEGQSVRRTQRNAGEGINHCVAFYEPALLYGVLVDAPYQAPGEFGWVEIDFPDILVTPGHTYYIVSITENETDNWYGWGGNNDSESYPPGCAWFSYDEGDSWTNESSLSNSQNSESTFRKPASTKMDEYITWDTCFKTYGRDSIPPDPPVINGPRTARYNESQSYIFTTNDPDGDDVFYQILWGDGTSEEWIGPYGSDELITVYHTWEEIGIFIIAARAMDIYGYVGDWTEFEVEIPRYRQYYQNILNWLFDRFPLFRNLIVFK